MRQSAVLLVAALVLSACASTQSTNNMTQGEIDAKRQRMLAESDHVQTERQHEIALQNLREEALERGNALRCTTDSSGKQSCN